MITHPHSILYYDAGGHVIGTNEVVVAHDPQTGEALGIYDFAAHEEAGGKLRDFGDDHFAVGAGTWPEFLGISAHDFRVELDERKRIVRLHHRGGHVRHRHEVQAAVNAVIAEAAGRPADIRHLVGGPARPLQLDEHGRTRARVEGDAKRPPLHGQRDGLIPDAREHQ